MLEKWFKLKENNTNIKTEVVAGVTTFMTMAYILAVNPSILSESGMDSNAILMATALASFIGTLAMAFLANYPFALAPGLGLNAYFAYTVCGAMGYSWQVALLAVFVEGLIFIVLSVTNVREAIFNAIPVQLKKGVSVGIGLFIAFIGFQNAGIVVNSDSTLVTVIDFTADFHTAGISALLAIIGTFIIVILHIKKVRGSILIGIFATWILGILCQLTGLYTVTPDAGYYSLLPSWSSFSVTSLGLTFGQCFKADFGAVKITDFIVIILAFLFVDIFDTLGTLIGCANKANMLDKAGRLPRIKQALLADAIATSAGAVLGTSTTTTFVESSSGVAEGGRTGLASVVTGFLFLLAIFFAPIFTAIPGFATAPALLFVGFLMITAVTQIDFDDLTEAVPAYLCLLAMPLLYSISEGIAVGVISYVIINAVCGKAKKITPLMYILAVLFVCKYIFL
ncbi:MAG: NCS2 family permease [Lachnospiraceae bacterium]|nr:NCS2 family permease [Lachnospiraceae bacterium]